jgi:uncharacterized protein YfiM (DUF2279 family)
LYLNTTHLLVKAILGLVLSAGFSSQALAWADDPWQGKDKALQFGISAASSAVASAALTKYAPAHAGFAETFMLGMAPGILREALWPNPSYKDLAWDAAGAAVGAYFGVKFVARPMTDAAGRFEGVHLVYRSSF